MVINKIKREINLLTTALVMISFLVLSGCSTVKPRKVEENAALARYDSCLDFYYALDEKVTEEEVRDIQAMQIEDYPFLSINRFLISFQNELSNKEKRDFWLAEAMKLNLQTRKLEWQNISTTGKKEIENKFLSTWHFKQRIEACGEVLVGGMSESEKKQAVDQARVSEVYSTAMRIFGLYPITSLFVSRQIDKHQAVTKASFLSPLRELPVRGLLQRYVPSASNLSFSHTVSGNNPLNIPVHSQIELNELFNRYAPVLEIDETGNYDHIGVMQLDNNNIPYVETNKPAVYYMPSYTRFEGKSLLQLNYFFWFPERPLKSKYDIYGGKLDGIIWRVTLNEDFSPILFDTVHNCGCYHKFYATDALDFDEKSTAEEREPILVAQQNLKVQTSVPWVLRIDSGRHFVNRVYQESKFDENAKEYQLLSYDNLRSIQGNGLSKGLFDTDGIVHSSARLERFILWPMGVPSAGAMRQWGHHAVAFVGRRYFDEPFLIDKYFNSNSQAKTLDVAPK